MVRRVFGIESAVGPTGSSCLSSFGRGDDVITAVREQVLLSIGASVEKGTAGWTNLFGADLVHAIPRFLVVLDHVVKLVAEELPARADHRASQLFQKKVLQTSAFYASRENAPSNTDDDDGHE